MVITLASHQYQEIPYNAFQIQKSHQNLYRSHSFIQKNVGKVSFAWYSKFTILYLTMWPHAAASYPICFHRSCIWFLWPWRLVWSQPSRFRHSPIDKIWAPSPCSWCSLGESFWWKTAVDVVLPCCKWFLWALTRGSRDWWNSSTLVTLQFCHFYVGNNPVNNFKNSVITSLSYGCVLRIQTNSHIDPSFIVARNLMYVIET